MKKIILNISWLMLEYGARMISSLLISSILAKSLGVAEYGVFQYSLNIVVLFSAISFICGAEVLVPKLVNASIRKRKKLLDNAFILRLFFSIIGYMILVTYSFFTQEPQEIILISLLGLMIILGEPFHVITAYLQSQTNIKPKVITSLLATLFKTIFVLILFFISVKKSNAFSFAWILESSITAIGLVFLYYQIYKNFNLQFSKKTIIYLLKKGLPFFYSLLSMYLFIKLDYIFLKAYSNNYELGLYAASYQITLAINAIAPILTMSLAPILVYKKTVFQDAVKNIMLITAIMAFTSLITAFIINLFSTPIITLLFGQEYRSVIDILYWQLYASVFIFIDSSLNIFFIKYQKGAFLLSKWILASIFSAISLYFYIPIYGALGAVIGCSVGYITACLFSLILIIFDARRMKGRRKIEKDIVSNWEH